MYRSYVYIFYALGLTMFLNFSNPLLFWLMMELNLIFFCLIMIMNKTNFSQKDSFNFVLYYFLIQSGSSILFLGNFSFLDWGSIFNSDNMFLISMILKIGLFPLFFWIFSISHSLGYVSLLLLLTIQKIPLLLIFFFSDCELSSVIILLSFVFGSTMVFFSENFLFMLISSSISYTFMFFFFFSFSTTSFFIFFLSYSFFVGLAVSFSSSLLPISYTLLFVAFSFFLGLPPLSLFFFKLIFVSDLLSFYGFSEILFFWLFTVVGMIGYLKMFYFSFFKSLSLYANFLSCMKTYYFLLVSLCFSFVCLL